MERVWRERAGMTWRERAGASRVLAWRVRVAEPVPRGRSRGACFRGVETGCRGVETGCRLSQQLLKQVLRQANTS